MSKPTVNILIITAIALTLSATSAWRELSSGNTSAPTAPNRGVLFAQAEAPDSPFLDYSDERLKTRVLDLRYGLDETLRLRPVSFRYSDWPSHPRIGLIAQEVQEVIPEAVSLDRDDDEFARERYYRVDYGQMIPLLIRSVQEQQALIERLEGRVLDLESEVASRSSRSGEPATP